MTDLVKKRKGTKSHTPTDALVVGIHRGGYYDDNDFDDRRIDPMVGYVASVSNTRLYDEAVVIAPAKGREHGIIFSSWILLEGYDNVDDLTVNNLPDKLKEALSKTAILKADNLGYCDESKKVLAAMGLPTSFKKKVKVVVEVDVAENEMASDVVAKSGLKYLHIDEGDW